MTIQPDLPEMKDTIIKWYKLRHERGEIPEVLLNANIKAIKSPDFTIGYCKHFYAKAQKDFEQWNLSNIN